MELSKVINLSKGLSKTLLVLERVLLILVVAMVVLMAGVTFAQSQDPSIQLGTGFNELSFGSVTLALGSGFTLSSRNALTFAWTIVASFAIYCILAVFGMRLLRKILKPMTEGNPFSKETGMDIKRLAYWGLAVAIAQNLFNFIEAVVVIKLFNLGDFTGNDVIQGVTVDLNLNLTWVFVFFILLLLSYVFSYGSELQKLSDETL